MPSAAPIGPVNPAIGICFADNSLPDYDEGAAKLLKQRVLGFLDNIH